MVSINQKIPGMELEAYHKDKVKKIRLSEYKGKWLAIVFYPADFTFICPTELSELADNYEQFKKIGAEVLSVSTDKVETHKAWHDTSPSIQKIKFPMVADPAGKMSREFGVYIEHEGKALRGSFIIDPDGVLKACEIHDNDIGRSVRELLRKVQAAKFVRETKGEVCPASWEPGKETLKPGMDLVGKL